MKKILAKYEQDLKINMVRLKKICPYFDYHLELSFGIEMLKDQLLVATEKEEREGIQSTITQFEKLLNEFVTSGANMDPNVLRQWVNEFDIVAADGFVLALDKENKPKLACVEALTSLCVLDELSETMPIILENCLYKLNTEEYQMKGSDSLMMNAWLFQFTLMI